MTTLLDTQSETLQAADGRFFIAEEAAFFNEQLPIANVALGALVKIEQARIIVGTGAACPTIISETAMDDARGQIIDNGALWRRETDKISHATATRFPRRSIGALASAGHFYTDEHKLYAVADEGEVAYYSLLSQSELTDGMRMANEDEWHNLLVRMKILFKQGR